MIYCQNETGTFEKCPLEMFLQRLTVIVQFDKQLFLRYYHPQHSHTECLLNVRK